LRRPRHVALSDPDQGVTVTVTLQVCADDRVTEAASGPVCVQPPLNVTVLYGGAGGVPVSGAVALGQVAPVPTATSCRLWPWVNDALQL